MVFNKNIVGYTLTETLKIFEIGFANPTKVNTKSFWEKQADDGVLPNRSWESMINHYKTVKMRGVEEVFQNLVQYQTRYCHAFQEIPQVGVPLQR